ncbi:hypothetical protein [Brevibacillus reuszeri]|uniref:hypothetical protein n=1 Tax=Brevibacillus reuszeri TaxID=54915 RepID=UPI001F22B646|nr:hypothetical protein [Brevibacillus reuszeri]
MVLIEQDEHNDQRNKTNGNKIITTEELTMIRDYILLPHMEQMVQKSIVDIEYSTNILKRLYILASQKILDQIQRDISKLRHEFRKRNIKVLSEEQANHIVYHRYYCRGYEDWFGMTRDVMRAEISLQLTKYTAQLAKVIST